MGINGFKLIMKSIKCFVLFLASVSFAAVLPENSKDLMSSSTLTTRTESQNPKQNPEVPFEVMNIDPQVGIPNLPPRNKLIPHIFHLRGGLLDRRSMIEKRSTTSTKDPSQATATPMEKRNIPSFQEYLKMMGLENTTEPESRAKRKRSKKRRDMPDEEESTPESNEKEETPKKKENKKEDEDEDSEDDATAEDRSVKSRIAPSKNNAKVLDENTENLKKQYQALLDLVAAQNRFVIPQTHGHKHTVCHTIGRMRRCIQTPVLVDSPYDHLINKVRYQSQLVKTITSGIFLRPPY